MAKGGDRKSEEFKNQGAENFLQVEKPRNQTTAEKIAEKIGVSDKTYRDMKQ